MIRIKDIRLGIDQKSTAIIDEAAKILCLDKIYPGSSYPDFSYKILKRSIDARKKPDIYYVYTILVLITDEDEKRILKFFSENHHNRYIRKMAERISTDPVGQYSIPCCGDIKLSERPVVIGAGPAGLFAALLLARRGFEPIVIERGESVDDRKVTVDSFWKGAALSTDSNVQFGEGGAGTFSDGKLTTLTKDRYGRNTFIINTFYEHGAPADITVDNKPHIGTDILRNVVKSIREEILSLGGEVRFNTRMTDISISDGRLKAVTVRDVKTGQNTIINTEICILCIGHSARDTFEMLHQKGIRMSQKSFAVGFRAIHPQSLVNSWQYGFEDAAARGLPPADYKVAYETSKGRRVYSFCMCPGGYVVNASSEDNRCCVNGMSEHDRDSRYANSAIIAAVDPCDYDQDEVAADHPLAGMYYQRRIEEAAYERGGGVIPVQRFEDYEADNVSNDTVEIGDAFKGAVKSSHLRGIFSEDIDEAIIESMHKFGYTMKGFDPKALLAGVEARTSSPVRIERGDNLESDVKGLYPCGEGAGYAGGIVSAAADGIRCAEMIIKKYYRSEKQNSVHGET